MNVTKVSLLDAIERGALGPFAIGTSRHAVGQTLGEPSDATIMNRKRTLCIWRYGAIEFHFDHDLLILIHCDADDLFDGGSTMVVDPWKLQPRMPLAQLKTILDAKTLHYTRCGDPADPDCLLRFDNGFSLGFVLDCDAGIGPTGLRSWSIKKNVSP